jgi:hypothetical protein
VLQTGFISVGAVPGPNEMPAKRSFTQWVLKGVAGKYFPECRRVIGVRPDWQRRVCWKRRSAPERLFQDRYT